jgi:glycosyltransferase involved in cell wall biosynthesis
MTTAAAQSALPTAAIPQPRPTSVPPTGTASAQRASLTVILPVFNEAATLPATLATVIDYAKRAPDVYFVFVDDGSTDDTRSILAAAVPAWSASIAQLAPVSFLSYPQNRGKGHAIAAAVKSACTDLVCFIDGDLAYDLDHLPVIIASLRKADIVIGTRKESPAERRNTKKLRRLMGFVFNGMVRIGMRLPHEDTQAGLKGFRTIAARTIFSRTRLRGFAFDVEVLYLARRHGFTVSEMSARVSRSHRAKASNVNLVLEPLRMARDLATIRINSLLGRYR